MLEKVRLGTGRESGRGYKPGPGKVSDWYKLYFRSVEPATGVRCLASGHAVMYRMYGTSRWSTGMCDAKPPSAIAPALLYLLHPCSRVGLDETSMFHTVQGQAPTPTRLEWCEPE